MQIAAFFIVLVLLQLGAARLATIESVDGQTSLHFDFKTENGQQREEDIRYDNKIEATNKAEDINSTSEVTVQPVEYRGGYSFISADGYEYTVKYKANQNGFQPYVTAHKLANPPAIA